MDDAVDDGVDDGVEDELEDELDAAVEAVLVEGTDAAVEAGDDSVDDGVEVDVSSSSTDVEVLSSIEVLGVTVDDDSTPGMNAGGGVVSTELAAAIATPLRVTIATTPIPMLANRLLAKRLLAKRFDMMIPPTLWPSFGLSSSWWQRIDPTIGHRY